MNDNLELNLMELRYSKRLNSRYIKVSAQRLYRGYIRFSVKLLVQPSRQFNREFN